tara:strand:- start:206 stop:739 length:534 start_codon:yes stop_codon:yes gene_type:complete
MKKTHFFILLFLSYSYFGFSQIITGKLINLKSEEPVAGTFYLNGYPDKLTSESIQNDGTFIIRDLENISSIEIVLLGYGTIILTGYDHSIGKNYDLGNLYFIDNPNNELYHVIYRTKIGYYLSWLTEGFRTRRWTKKEINKNHKSLKDKYSNEGKSSGFLKKYDGNNQILNLKSLSI